MPGSDASRPFQDITTAETGQALENSTDACTGPGVSPRSMTRKPNRVKYAAAVVVSNTTWRQPAAAARSSISRTRRAPSPRPRWSGATATESQQRGIAVALESRAGSDRAALFHHGEVARVFFGTGERQGRLHQQRRYARPIAARGGAKRRDIHLPLTLSKSSSTDAGVPAASTLPCTTSSCRAWQGFALAPGQGAGADRATGRRSPTRQVVRLGVSTLLSRRRPPQGTVFRSCTTLVQPRLTRSGERWHPGTITQRSFVPSSVDHHAGARCSCEGERVTASRANPRADRAAGR